MGHVAAEPRGGLGVGPAARPPLIFLWGNVHLRDAGRLEAWQAAPRPFDDAVLPPSLAARQARKHADMPLSCGARHARSECVGVIRGCGCLTGAGAIRASKWINGKPAGYYEMSDVLGL